MSVTIAVLGDTHDDGVDREGLLRALEPSLKGVAHILHTGDVTTEAFLDDLERFAPVTAVRSTADPDLPPRLTDGPRRLDIDGCRIELVRVLDGSGTVERDDVDVVVHGATHVPAVETAGSTIYVNPGSPVFTETPAMALVHIEDGDVRVERIDLPAN